MLFEQGFDRKSGRERNFFNPIHEFRPDNPLNP
jgi:hypothetical protein